MRTLAVIGSGIAGLLTAHGLLRAGHAVTLFSDRTAEQWLHASRPTGTAGRAEVALSYERELGLDHWATEAPAVTGIHCTFCERPPNRLLTLTGRIQRPFLAIDVRLQSSRWMGDLVARGGRIVVEPVTLGRLDEIAAQHDLTIVASGKSELSSLFERDAVRSGHERPARHVAMVIARKPGGLPAGADPARIRASASDSAAAGTPMLPSMRFEGIPFVAVKFDILGAEGEVLLCPYLHAGLGATWNLLFEARPGGPMDVFQDASSGAEVLRLAKQVIRASIPWDWPWARDLELADDHGWQVGRFAPTVRRPVGRLPSGRVVTSVGDAAMLFDPLAGQGANNGTKMARHLVASVAERGDRPFDAAWMERTFEAFLAQHGAPAYTFTSLLLEAPTPAMKELLIAQYGSDGLRRDGRQALADAFAENLADPRRITAILGDLAAMRRFIERTTGQAWWRSALRGRLAIARGQIRQKLGLAPGHPLEVA